MKLGFGFHYCDLTAVKSGFINIIGPNVGKSTLMNAGERLVFKAQTTRHRILGIVNGPDHQMVFSDTPGIIEPAYSLQRKMMGFVSSALEDADILLYVVNPKPEPSGTKMCERINDHPAPLLLLINKVDQTDQNKLEALHAHWQSVHPRAEIIPISALHEFQTEYLLQRLIEILPEGPAYFDGETLTDRNERFFTSEIIRENILQLYEQEVPYSCEVEIESFVEGEERHEIRAVVHVSRDSQKGILIGHQGKALRKLAERSRKQLKVFFGKTVFLELYIKVNKDWRKSDRQLKRFGYNP